MGNSGSNYRTAHAQLITNELWTNFFGAQPFLSPLWRVDSGLFKTYYVRCNSLGLIGANIDDRRIVHPFYATPFGDECTEFFDGHGCFVYRRNFCRRQAFSIFPMAGAASCSEQLGAIRFILCAQE